MEFGLSLTSHHLSDEDEQLWVWEYATDQGGHDLFMDINEEIRFRVVDEMFTDLSPAGPEMSGEKKSTDEQDNKRSPYSITVSLSFNDDNKVMLMMSTSLQTMLVNNQLVCLRLPFGVLYFVVFNL